MKTVIFDLDGTLADTSGDLIAAANVCFRQLGFGDVLDPGRDQRTAMMGGAKAMLRLGFERLQEPNAELRVDENYAILLKAYAADIDRYTQLYPRAVVAIEALLGSGYAVGLCTNKPQALAEQLLTSLGVRDLFASLIGADTLSVRKPDPEPLRAAIERAGGDLSRALLVGDSETDRETARAAGVGSVLVTFGPDGHAVAQLSPDALLDHYDDLSKVVARLIG